MVTRSIGVPGTVLPQRWATVRGVTGLQAVLDAGPDRDGVVYLRAGVYATDPTVGLTVRPGTRLLMGDGYETVIKVPDGHNSTGNLLRVTGCDDLTIRDLRLDGNRANQSAGNNYGLFLDSCTNSRLERVWAHGFTGVAVQVYNCDSCVISGCVAWDNEYHGFECEQSRGCMFGGNSSYGNDRHGMFVSPGEVGGSGSLGNQIVKNSFATNGQYGLSVGEDAGGLSAWLSTGNVIAHNDVRGNGEYGVQLWKVNGNAVVGNSVDGNGKFGIHLYRAAANQVTGNVLTGNGQQAANAWDEIILEGFTDDSGHPSRDNIIAGNTIRSIGANHARWAVNEASSGDGPNIITGNMTVGTFGSGGVRRQHVATAVSSPAGVHLVSGGQFIPSGAAGIDNGFSTLRLVNDGGQVQIVTATAQPITFWVNGSNMLTLGAGGQVGFYGAGGTTKPTVTGSRGSNAALASLLTALAGLGILTDSTS